MWQSCCCVIIFWSVGRKTLFLLILQVKSITFWLLPFDVWPICDFWVKNRSEYPFWVSTRAICWLARPHRRHRSACFLEPAMLPESWEIESVQSHWREREVMFRYNLDFLPYNLSALLAVRPVHCSCCSTAVWSWIK